MKKCKGLPLVVVVITGLLANKKTWWKQISQSVSSYIVSDPNQYLDTLALSYNHLLHHLKPCFLYLVAFPKDQEISVQRLLWLWIAEGFIQKKWAEKLGGSSRGLLNGSNSEKSYGSKYSNNVLNGLLFICETFKLLRVLDLWCVYGLFSRKLEHVNLRYLAITVGGSVQLPLPISNLANLDTLIHFASMSEVTLSRNVWKIPKLRNLYTKEEKYSVSLSSAMDHNFLRHPETLKLYNNFCSQPTTFQGVKFPTNIKRLTLTNTGTISILRMLLPNLELLKLESEACWGLQWATNDRGFPLLKFLKLKCLNVEQWITCSSYFPSLRHLLLESCDNLEEIPSSLGDILTLQMITIAYCRPPIVESARKIKEEQ
ncbi:late blight resistance protein R1-A-like [Camellia sinensis]|uniref:late blight resistance protein R1-A-like n=1 Tax=Camellia sinensis TaxID=4442 RepID=UPI001035ECE7|nr:late blight resistance protein R1-A-like [Camellia sinensis]